MRSEEKKVDVDKIFSSLQKIDNLYSSTHKVSDILLQLKNSKDVDAFLDKKGSKYPHKCGLHYLVYANPEQFNRIIQLASPSVLSGLEKEFGDNLVFMKDTPISRRSLFRDVCWFQPLANIQLYMQIVGPINLVTQNISIQDALSYNKTLSDNERKKVHENYKKMIKDVMKEIKEPQQDGLGKRMYAFLYEETRGSYEDASFTTNAPLLINDSLVWLNTEKAVNDFFGEGRQRSLHSNLHSHEGIHRAFEMLLRADPEHFNRIIRLVHASYLFGMEETIKEDLWARQSKDNINLYMQKASLVDIVNSTTDFVASTSLLYLKKCLDKNTSLSPDDRKEIYTLQESLFFHIKNTKESVKKNPDEFIQFIQWVARTRSSQELRYSIASWDEVLETAISCASREEDKNHLRALKGFFYLKSQFGIKHFNPGETKEYQAVFAEVKRLQVEIKSISAIPSNIKELMAKERNVEITADEKKLISDTLSEIESSVKNLSKQRDDKYDSLPKDKIAMDKLIQSHSAAVGETKKYDTKQKEAIEKNIHQSWGKITSLANTGISKEITGEVLDRLYRTPEKFQGSSHSHEHSKGEMQLRAFRLGYEVAKSTGSNQIAGQDFLETIGYPQGKNETNKSSFSFAKKLIIDAIVSEKRTKPDILKNLAPALIENLTNKFSDQKALLKFCATDPGFQEVVKNSKDKVLISLLKEIEQCAKTMVAQKQAAKTEDKDTLQLSRVEEKEEKRREVDSPQVPSSTSSRKP